MADLLFHDSIGMESGDRLAFDLTWQVGFQTSDSMIMALSLEKRFCHILNILITEVNSFEN